MKNQHKAKGYRLESKIQKSTFLEFRRQLFPDPSDWLETYIVKPNPQIEKYLIQYQMKDLSYISSLNKIDRYLHNQQKGVNSKIEKEYPTL